MTMTVRGCPETVHEAFKNSAKANRRSLNKETLTWLEKQLAREQVEPVVTGKEAARILREANRGLTAEDRRQIANGIEEARKRMNLEHLSVSVSVGGGDPQGGGLLHNRRASDRRLVPPTLRGALLGKEIGTSQGTLPVVVYRFR